MSIIKQNYGEIGNSKDFEAQVRTSQSVGNITIPEGTKKLFVCLSDNRDGTDVYYWDTTLADLKAAGSMVIQRSGTSYYAHLIYVNDTTIQAYLDWYASLCVIVCGF